MIERRKEKKVDKQNIALGHSLLRIGQREKFFRCGTAIQKNVPCPIELPMTDPTYPTYMYNIVRPMYLF